MKQRAIQAGLCAAVFCLVASAAHGSQLPSHEKMKFNRFAGTGGVTRSGASSDETFYYDTSLRTRVVRLTIVHLESREATKNEYAVWLKIKGVRVIRKQKVQDKSGTTEDRAVVKMFVPSECDDGIAIFATTGKILRIIQSCSVKAAFEFEKWIERGENQNGG